MASVGGDPLPAVGFAMGDVVISLLLEVHNLYPDSISTSPASVLVTVFDKECHDASLKITTDIRQAGISVVCYPEITKLPKQFKYADRMDIPIALVIGPDEAANGTVTIKDLKAGAQLTVINTEVLTKIRELLKTRPE
jgi:histidyl-tRNA synthetase